MCAKRKWFLGGLNDIQAPANIGVRMTGAADIERGAIADHTDTATALLDRSSMLLRHGPRSFLVEVGIIVLGVFIALVGEQLVQSWRWAQLVKQQRQVLTDELTGALTMASVRLQQAPCFEKRLSEIRIILERHKRDQPLGIKGSLGAPTYSKFSTGAWATALNSETLDHMLLGERQEWGGAFEGFNELTAVFDVEHQLWMELGQLNYPELLEPEDWSDIRRTFSKATAMNERAAFLSKWMLEQNAKGQKPHPVKLDFVLSMKPTTRTFCEAMI